MDITAPLNFLTTHEDGNHGVILYGRRLGVSDREELAALQEKVLAWCAEHEDAAALVTPNLLEEMADIVDQECFLGLVIGLAAEGKRPTEIASAVFSEDISVPDSLWQLAEGYDDQEPRLYLLPSGWCGVELSIGQLDADAAEEHECFDDEGEPTGEYEEDDWDEGCIDGDEVAMVSSEDTYCYVELSSEAKEKLRTAERAILMHCYYI